MSALVERLRLAVEDRDIDALVACFARDYVNETPAHPARGFTGRDQVRTNWTRLFAGLESIGAEVTRQATADEAGVEVVWSEWELSGRRAGGGTSALRGVIVFGVVGGLFAWARFYLEPVDEPLDDEADGVDAAVGRVVEG
jgi:ketosteroid isomerase-like protein